MYKLDATTIEKLQLLVGRTILQICVGEFTLKYLLDPQVSISIEGGCELQNAMSEVADVWNAGARTTAFAGFVDMIGASVSHVSADDHSTLRIRFEDGRQLVLFDRSAAYESFTIGEVIV